MRRKLPLGVAVMGLLAVVPLYFLVSGLASSSSDNGPATSDQEVAATVDPAVAARFSYLSANGNSSCSLTFMNSIASMPADMRLRGSCCSPMRLHRYSEQVAALKKYRTVAEIPSDPYDIEAPLAAKLMGYYALQLTPAQQQAYDFAMKTSSDHGPCCCQCWRWEVYGGLAKDLIRNYGFSGEQVTEVWNFSDGCGGDSQHFHGTTTTARPLPYGSSRTGQEVPT